MSLFIASLNSGSNGNCYYIGNHREAVLIDAGISCRETERRMKRAGLSMQKVKAVFISHEHTDHIRGLEVLSRRYQLPVYITSGTLSNSRLKLQPALVREFSENENVHIGSIRVLPFSKSHDAADPHSFVLESEGATVGVFTDIGYACPRVAHHFSGCHAAFLEANYDEHMLENGRYPAYLKKRIRSQLGHLSNDQALELFSRYRPVFMSHLLLSHLSAENNDPRLVHDLFAAHAGNTRIAVASRYEEGPVFHISAKASQRKAGARAVQTSLF
ncbi:MAG: MBL fold metallo-hydrolase [Bacteroidota bacterium]